MDIHALPTDEQLAEARKFLLDPKYHKSRLKILDKAIASKRVSRTLFRGKTEVLNLLLNLAETCPEQYKDFRASVIKEFKNTNAADVSAQLGARRRVVSDAVKRSRDRQRLVRAILAYELNRVPTREELRERVGRYQREWAKRAAEELLLDPQINQVQQRRAVYDTITAELQAEVKRLKEERNAAKRKLESGDPQ